MIRIFLLLAFASVACASPPEVPKSIPANVGELVTLEVKGKLIGYQPTFSSTDVFFARLHTDDPDVLSFVVQVKPGRNPKSPLAVVFWTVGEKVGVACVLDTGDALLPVPPVKPVDPPPVTPPTPVALYFLIVRPDGPASPAFSATMGLPAWDAIRKAGHSVKDRTVSEVAPLGYTVPPGTALPVVFTLDNSGPRSKILRGPSPLPTDANGIGLLPTEVK